MVNTPKCLFLISPNLMAEQEPKMETTTLKSVTRVIQAHIAPVGTFTVKRALPDRDLQSIGPWVFLDHFGPFRVKPGEDGVGPHPHAGIETVTYLLSGRNEHLDSAGHRGIVGPLGAQWMTSGRGIVHAEYPRPENEAEMTQHGLQLWTTLPRALKLMAPRYQRIEAADIPTVAGDGFAVRVIAGSYESNAGPADVLMPTLLWHVSVAPGQAFSADIPAGYELAAYVMGGTGAFSGGLQRLGVGSLVVYDQAHGSVSFSNSGSTTLDVMLLGGAPAEGPLLFHGPFVMNTVEQLRAAEVAYRSGQMGQLEG
jgi:redox-sensitive bicupin YhaK (pirin superfamily)